VIRFGSALGAVVSDLDLSQPVATATEDALNSAFAEHQLLYFPDQHLETDDFKRLASCFGKIARYPFAADLPGHPGVTEVIKSEDDTVNFGGVWHSDTTYTQTPPMASMLYSRIVPAAGGDTLFANMYAAWDALSSGMKATLSKLNAVNTSSLRSASGSNMRAKFKRSMNVDNIDNNDLSAVHPVARTHPVTGRTALYLNSAHTKNFQGMTAEESAPLLSFLFQHLKQPEFCTRLSWQPNAIAIWDNRCTQHYAVNDYHGERRVMHRITLSE